MSGLIAEFVLDTSGRAVPDLTSGRACAVVVLFDLFVFCLLKY